MKRILFILFIFLSIITKAQNDYEKLKEYVVSIGVKQATKNGFIYLPVGSGVMTYCKVKDSIIDIIVTARHVVEFFEKNSIPFSIRLSWEDSIKTTIDQGATIPLMLDKNNPSYFYSSDNDVDLASIIFLSSQQDTLINNLLTKKAIKLFPRNSIVNPNLGDNVYVFGYPGHIENEFDAIYNYSICTFKPGIVTWNSNYNSNESIDKFILIESNASYGNSGGPVFAINHDFMMRDSIPRLIGILVSGFNENDTLRLNNKAVYDSNGHPYLTTNRAGVCQVVKAKFIMELITQIEAIFIKSKYYLQLFNIH